MIGRGVDTVLLALVRPVVVVVERERGNLGRLDDVVEGRIL